MTADHVLVTGGAGFIGSHVADAFLSMGHEVVVLDDLAPGDRARVPHGARFVRFKNGSSIIVQSSQPLPP